jgi:surface protein
MDVYLPYAYAYSGLFEGCSSLESARIQGGRDAGKFSYMNNLFAECTSLKNVELIDIKTGGEQEFKSVFYKCRSLESIDLSTLNFSSAKDLSSMFQACSSLKEIDLSPVDFSNVKDMSAMFAGCTSLTSLDLSGHSWVSGGAKMSQVISHCPALH